METKLPILAKSKPTSVKNQEIPTSYSCCSPKGNASVCCTPNIKPQDHEVECCTQPEDGSACCNK